MCILELSSQCLSEEDTVCILYLVRRTLELSSQCLSEEDTVCVYSRTVLSVLVRRTRFVCILDLSSQCLSEEDTVCMYSRPQS